MSPLAWNLLPLGIGIIILSLAALSQAWATRVPNMLTLPAIVAGWGFAIYADRVHQAPWTESAFVASILGTLLALAILLPAYVTQRLGAGCVKAQMAFAAWACIAVPLVPALCMIASATVGGLIVSFAYLHLAVADFDEQRRYAYAFPAQVTMTVVAIMNALACWIIAAPA